MLAIPVCSRDPAWLCLPKPGLYRLLGRPALALLLAIDARHGGGHANDDGENGVRDP